MKLLFFNFIHLRFLDIIDILMVATLLYYIYKLVRGTAAINIFIGIVMIYGVWQLTKVLDMLMLSTILGEFIGVGMFALIVVFQQEIRKFLLMVGSANIKSRKLFLSQLKFLKDSEAEITTNVAAIIKACENMSTSLTGALIIIKRNTSLDFVKNSGDHMNVEINVPILESIFYKNSPLHDGALIIEGNLITATRVIIPVSGDINIPARFGLRHRAAISITQKTDALALIVSEETGQISYINNGEFVAYKTPKALIEQLNKDLG